MRTWTILAALLLTPTCALAQRTPHAPADGPESSLSVLVGRPTDDSAVISVLADAGSSAWIEYGTRPGRYDARTPSALTQPGEPTEFELTGLKPDSTYVYRLHVQHGDKDSPSPQPEHQFHTARKPGGSFTFAVQGDSHPERPGRMYDPDLYLRTLRSVAADRPDFYFTMGDDFSTERLYEQNTLSQASVDDIYSRQRAFLAVVGSATPLMLVNGNHEQAARYLLDGTAANGAVYAGKARTKFFPLPAPDGADTGPGFYSGNTEPVEHIGLLRDYYAWEWGDALFVVIDPYWHSPAVVDNQAGAKAPQRTGEQKRSPRAGQPADEQPDNRKGKGNRDLWQVTLGDTQYHWLETTLKHSRAKCKFVFCHHVLGTGRGGVEEAARYEWGGQDGAGNKRDRAPQTDAGEQPAQRGFARFFQNRPTWDKPIHALMRDTGVTIFFQGHDHLYAHQELDGVVYQTCPIPADPTYTAFNKDAYLSGDILPNSGYLRVTVSGGPDASVKVEYVRSFLPRDETDAMKHGMVAHSYTVRPHAQTTPQPPPERSTR
ncbi:MAG: metallophosphoesterase family protein [Phycisphaerales bacterium]